MTWHYIVLVLVSNVTLYAQLYWAHNIYIFTVSKLHLECTTGEIHHWHLLGYWVTGWAGGDKGYLLRKPCGGEWACVCWPVCVHLLTSVAIEDEATALVASRLCCPHCWHGPCGKGELIFSYYTVFYMCMLLCTLFHVLFFSFCFILYVFVFVMNVISYNVRQSRYIQLNRPIIIHNNDIVSTLKCKC